VCLHLVYFEITRQPQVGEGTTSRREGGASHNVLWPKDKCDQIVSGRTCLNS
jgi:hypothetical protein